MNTNSLCANINYMGSSLDVPEEVASAGTAISTPLGLYVSTGNKWIFVSNKFSTYSIKEDKFYTYDIKEKELLPHECPRCGAVLRAKSNKCDYCLTEFF